VGQAVVDAQVNEAAELERQVRLCYCKGPHSSFLHHSVMRVASPNRSQFILVPIRSHRQILAPE
jgi:hypothetical protein